MRREPREADLPEVPADPLPARSWPTSSRRWLRSPSRLPPPPEVVPREITIGQQIAVLQRALSRGGRVVLQAILARCRSRTEASVTFLATLELVRRRQVTGRAARAVRADRHRVRARRRVG
jgi:chromatin segregation and condensation protein Rec8/ScpA/Scc1 (kleisin family)